MGTEEYGDPRESAGGYFAGHDAEPNDAQR